MMDSGATDPAPVGTIHADTVALTGHGMFVFGLLVQPALAAVFGAKTDFTVGLNPQSVALADLNGDGKPDLATANENVSSVSVLLSTTMTGAATPTFLPRWYFTVGSGPYSVVV